MLIDEFVGWLIRPWPWYVSGPLIGLMVPLLLWLGNKSFGISGNLRNGCAILLPDSLPNKAKPAFFRYDWKKETWNLLFALGLVLGGFLATVVLASPQPVALSQGGQQAIATLGVELPSNGALLPTALTDLSKPAVWLLMAISGLLVGFGTRYGGGCTSGHAITGLSTLQLPSLVATVSFFVGGIISANLLLPILLRWVVAS